MSNSTIVLSGQQLIGALAVTTTPISLFLHNQRVRTLAPDEVIGLMNDDRYQFIGRKSRVRLIRQLDPSALIPIPWRPHLEFGWRTSKAAVCWPYLNDDGTGS